MDILNSDEFKSMTKEEQEAVIKMLEEYSKGSNETYTKLLKQDYNEIPVDIETFITDDRYLGKAWKKADGSLAMYPFWLDTLKKIFPDGVTTNYNTLLESGARGIGKSEIAVGAVCSYLLYRVMCLKNPLSYFGLKPTESICFAFMNIKLALSEEIATSKFQNTIQQSPWFMSKGSLTQFHNKPYWIPPAPIKIIIGSQSDDVIGLPIFYAFFDEISFIKNQDVEKQKQKANDMINTAIGGMKTRFIHNGKNPTVLVVASSKRSDQSFMESYIRKLSETDPSTYIVDRPVWEIKPKGTYSDKTFKVAQGTKFLSSVIVGDDEDNDVYYKKGYTKILNVPIDFKADFLKDIDRSMCDFAGISSASTNSYISGEIVSSCINETYKNPLPDIIETGNAPDDTAQYKNFFNMEAIPKELLKKPLFIHLDMSISGDMTGIAGVWIVGKKVSTEQDQSKDLAFRLAFSTSVKAPKGYQISFEKNRNFIRWLKSAGFKIVEITADTFQSYDLLQTMKAEGYNCSQLSVDRVDTDHVCKPYQYLKSTLYEKRFVMYKSERLRTEFVEVERNIDSGKVDHPPNGHKDVLDAVCGATFTASKYAEQYAYDYGEDLKITLEFNENKTDIDDILNDVGNQLIDTYSKTMYDNLKQTQSHFYGGTPMQPTPKQVRRTTKAEENTRKDMWAASGIIL